MRNQGPVLTSYEDALSDTECLTLRHIARLLGRKCSTAVLIVAGEMQSFDGQRHELIDPQSFDLGAIGTTIDDAACLGGRALRMLIGRFLVPRSIANSLIIY